MNDDSLPAWIVRIERDSSSIAAPFALPAAHTTVQFGYAMVEEALLKHLSAAYALAVGEIQLREVLESLSGGLDPSKETLSLIGRNLATGVRQAQAVPTGKLHGVLVSCVRALLDAVVIAVEAAGATRGTVNVRLMASGPLGGVVRDRLTDLGFRVTLEST